MAEDRGLHLVDHPLEDLFLTLFADLFVWAMGGQVDSRRYFEVYWIIDKPVERLRAIWKFDKYG